MAMPMSGELAQLGKSVVIKGELSGSEDLYVDGQVEGRTTLKGKNLRGGPTARLKPTSKQKVSLCRGNSKVISTPATGLNCAKLRLSLEMSRPSVFPSKK